MTILSGKKKQKKPDRHCLTILLKVLTNRSKRKSPFNRVSEGFLIHRIIYLLKCDPDLKQNSNCDISKNCKTSFNLSEIF